MIITTQNTYNIKCDGCDKLCDPDGWHDCEDSIVDHSIFTSWVEKDNKHYCQDCYCFDENDNIVIKKQIL